MAEYKTTIQQNNENFAKLYNSGQSVKDLYTENARLYPPGTGGKVFTGRDEIHAFWTGAYAAGVKDLKLTINQITHTGEYLIEESSYVHSLGHGRYVVIWKNVNGHWFLDSDIFNA